MGVKEWVERRLPEIEADIADHLIERPKTIDLAIKTSYLPPTRDKHPRVLAERGPYKVEIPWAFKRTVPENHMAGAYAMTREHSLEGDWCGAPDPSSPGFVWVRRGFTLAFSADD